ncbi:MAG: hypothetical protein ABIA04_09460 [Pseudomonadota bacterium]
MASNTKIVKIVRKRKRKKMGAQRKKDNVKFGTTPKFPIHPEQVTE